MSAALFIASVAIVYGAFAFVLWAPNPAQWTEVARGAFCIVGLPVGGYFAALPWVIS